MRYRIQGRSGRRIAVVKLERGDEAISSLLEFCRRARVSSGTVSALGAVEKTTLGWFDRRRRVYVKRTFRGVVELASLTGNIARLGKNPILHAHVVCSGRSFRSVAGHLFSATVAVTVECVVIETGALLRRKPDPRFGLNLLDINEGR
ncbi:MAG: hypothetical protein A2Z34_01800 [Planctomycetes bacterium RBG_16_59_8]|nr:MAG: hypothetical protein A2Z34_01800 [Planctomycetes bacterium RBG_16_59_8]